jgi:hypothetical protein
MAMKDLAEKTTNQGAAIAVWHEDEEDTIVVQYEFVHLSFYKPEFKAFVETLNEAAAKLA